MQLRPGIAGLLSVSVIFACGDTGGRSAEIVNDVTKLNPILVERVVVPETEGEVSRLVAGRKGAVCIGGARHSQGGQIATRNCLFLDMRRMDRIKALDIRNRTVTADAGATWRQIQEKIDPYGLSLKVMQTYANFTIGGSLSVNAHGRYVGQGPIVGSVLSFRIVLADGRIVDASRSVNRDIFDAAIGGYGGLGVIVSATLQLVPNTPIERVAARMPVSQYKSYFFRNVAHARDAIFHNADLYPPDYRTLTSVTWFATDKPVTVPERLAPRGMPSAADRILLEWLSRGPLGKQVREYIYDPAQYSRSQIEWRNFEASYDAASLEPASRDAYTYGLQEYFIPVDHFEDFATALPQILGAAHANVLNVSIRHAKADTETILSWAPHEVFSFVLYFGEGVSSRDRQHVREWTDALIREAVREGGSYYLPYQIVASPAEFLQAYPRAPKFFALKGRLDPSCKFRNMLWDAYDPDPFCHPRP